jgi:hypothetical protein
MSKINKSAKFWLFYGIVFSLIYVIGVWTFFVNGELAQHPYYYSSDTVISLPAIAAVWLEAPKKISWVFESGDIFKSSIGSWVLEDEAGKTRATYTVEAKFNMFVPGPIAKALVSVNLPGMVSSYKKRVKELYGQ